MDNRPEEDYASFSANLATPSQLNASIPPALQREKGWHNCFYRFLRWLYGISRNVVICQCEVCSGWYIPLPFLRRISL